MRQDRDLRRRYGITASEYYRMYAQQCGCCAVCGGHYNSAGFGYEAYTVLVADHHHDTNKVRRLLCHDCNRLIGLMELKMAYVSKALSYIETDGRLSA